MGPSHHGTVLPQIADGGTASNMAGSSEYVNRGQPTRGGTPARGLGEVPTTPRRKNWHNHVTFTRATGLD